MPHFRLITEQSDCIWVGIDPGKSGAMALLIENRTTDQTALTFLKTPTTLEGLWAAVATIADVGRTRSVQILAVVELVRGYIGNAHPGSAMFRFGENYGAWLMALTGNNIPYVLCPPEVWQRRLNIAKRGKKERRPTFKRRLYEVTCEMYPEAYFIQQVADAILIATYARQQYPDALSPLTGVDNNLKKARSRRKRKR